MKKCELCSKVARMYCDSDQATLCWDCDSRVHAANFLVSKHVRTLLCHSCQSPTPWTGSGPSLGPTVSVCEACVKGRDQNIDRGRRNGNTEDDDEDQTDNEENDTDCVRDDDDDDGENQVVPLSLPQPTPSTSSRSQESSSRSSSFGLFGAQQSSRFSYHGSGRSEPENGTQNNRSWRWR